MCSTILSFLLTVLLLLAVFLAYSLIFEYKKEENDKVFISGYEKKVTDSPDGQSYDDRGNDTGGNFP